MTKLTLDTDQEIYFYEQDFYVFSNFSSFRINWRGHTFDTVEYAYHWAKFDNRHTIQSMILNAPSSHEAFQLAQKFKEFQLANWYDIRVSTMKDLTFTKIQQHEYVKRKLKASRGRRLVENSWRDDFWGWGEDRNGQNVLGQIYMDWRNYFDEYGWT
jgi:ribA/ribD-fused uncharacterized protein